MSSIFAACSDVERLIIRKERAGAGDVLFRLFVRAAMNGIVRALEKQRFAIQHQLHAGIVEYSASRPLRLSRGSTTEAVMSSSTCTLSAG